MASKTQLIEAIMAVERMKELDRKTAYLRWEAYPTQRLALNSTSPKVGLMAGNQRGKSEAAAHKTAWNALGEYPDWYEGHRSLREQDIWVVGETNETTRDSCQKKLFGPDIDNPGVGGIIPPERIVGKPSRRTGITGAIDTIQVRHKSGGSSNITFKSYEQGRKALASWTGDFIWVDEEPPWDCFEELTMRLIARAGQMLITFTPLLGETRLYRLLTEAPEGSGVENFRLPREEAKHITAQIEAELIALYGNNPAALKSRLEGVASISTGLVWPFDFGQLLVPDFKIPSYWPGLITLDTGWQHPTAAILHRWDPDTDCRDRYITKEHKLSQAPVEDHVRVLEAWGDFDIVYDHAANQTKGDGEKIIEKYMDLMDPSWAMKSEKQRRFHIANKAVFAGVDQVYKEFREQTTFIFESCVQTLSELTQYRYAEPSKKNKVETATEIYKVNDDLCDNIRYGAMGRQHMRPLGRARYEPSLVNQIVNQWKPAGRGY